jgi:glycosyltransferase involved in cell wall biosynthesis
MGIWRPVQFYSRASLRLSEQLERRAFGNAALVLACSEWAARLVQQECPSARVRIWHPGVDANRFSPASERPAGSDLTPYRLLFVGARFAAKGGEDLLEAVGHRLGRDIELDIVTPDPVAIRPGLRVHRLEPGAPQLVDLYRSSDLLCLPTRGDSFGWVVLEAMSCRVPVISSRMGAIPELLRPGTAEAAGIVVDARDPGALAQALDELLADPERRRIMGAAGRRAVLARHSTEVQMKRFLALVGEVLESAS